MCDCRIRAEGSEYLLSEHIYTYIYNIVKIR